MAKPPGWSIPERYRGLFEDALKPDDRARDLLDQAVAEGNSRAVFSEAYRRGDLSYHLHFSAIGVAGRKAVKLCAEIYRLGTEYKAEHLGARSSEPTSVLGDHGCHHPEDYRVEVDGIARRKGNTRDQEVVLVPIVVVTQKAKRKIRLIVPSAIRLKTLKACPISAYFPEVTLSVGVIEKASAPVPAPEVTDRKLRSASNAIAGAFDGDLVRQMIERRPQVVDQVAGNQRGLLQRGADILHAAHIEHALSRFRIELDADSWVILLPGEGSTDVLIQSLSVRFGTGYLGPNTTK